MFEDDDFDEIMFQMEDVQETECYSDSEKELPYCPCEEPNDQEMINCDGMQCEYEWWHYACAGLTSETIPEGKWICPECRKAKGRSHKTRSVYFKSARSFFYLITKAVS